MSAFFSFKYADCVRLLTDAGWYSADGSLVAVSSKVISLDTLPVAITGRGLNGLETFETITEMCVAAEDAETVDDVLRAFQVFFDGMAIRGDRDFEFLIAAWSETQGAVHFVVACHKHWKVPTFKLIPLGEQILAGPVIGWGELAHLGIQPEAALEADFPLRHGAAVMTAMRKKASRIPGSRRDLFLVGGHCDLTTVTAGGVTTTKLCEWGDEIGKPIDPSRGLKEAVNV
ncbi:hypothetical protein [Ferirhizobium litorale]|uniref:Uncharacterized protein n=1 Tax=Ferirhizobium litorale TaxID=2927786 RepID=A0AAE3U066_9HYPH|nr:hypothetical protein [Fererhizobium litorale]MDI7921744.1 hypothetical protein [Fererhizobium litorale]